MFLFHWALREKRKFISFSQDANEPLLKRTGKKNLRYLSIWQYLCVKKPRWIIFFSSHKIKPSTTDNTFQLVKKRNCRNWFLSILCGKRKNGGFYQQVFMHFILYSKIDFFLDDMWFYFQKENVQTVLIIWKIRLCT